MKKIEEKIAVICLLMLLLFFWAAIIAIILGWKIIAILSATLCLLNALGFCVIVLRNDK